MEIGEEEEEEEEKGWFVLHFFLFVGIFGLFVFVSLWFFMEGLTYIIGGNGNFILFQFFLFSENSRRDKGCFGLNYDYCLKKE